MTTALCFKCGATKFGALSACDECDAKATGNINLDIAFSDHRMSEESIKQFGEVVRAIRRVCDDEALCLWSFIYYVSLHHADILIVNIPAERRERCAAILAQARPPTVVVRESWRSRIVPENEPGTAGPS
jgi:hypothetical protein